MAFLWLLSCSALLGVSSCHGEPASLPELSIEPRVINGQDAHPNSSVWHALLLSRHGYTLCGGVLIKRNWVLTAAHCNVTKSSGAVIGLQNLGSAGKSQEMRITKIFRHPMFSPDTHHSDIALLKVRPRSHYKRNMVPIRLPRVDDKFFLEIPCKIMGWGYTDINGTRKPNKLQEASVTILNNITCIRLYPQMNPDVMMCAWGRDAGPHHDDFGGFLMCPKNGVWTLAGILSYSHDYRVTGIPFVATRITTFIPWIEETMINN